MPLFMNPTHIQRNRSSRIQYRGREVKIKAKWNNILSGICLCSLLDYMHLPIPCEFVPDVKFTFLFHPILIFGCVAIIRLKHHVDLWKVTSHDLEIQDSQIVCQILQQDEYKCSILFFMFYFMFYQSQLTMYLFNFSYKIAKVSSTGKSLMVV